LLKSNASHFLIAVGAGSRQSFVFDGGCLVGGSEQEEIYETRKVILASTEMMITILAARCLSLAMQYQQKNIGR
jgi:hypothetical protein